MTGVIIGRITEIVGTISQMNAGGRKDQNGGNTSHAVKNRLGVESRER